MLEKDAIRELTEERVREIVREILGGPMLTQAKATRTRRGELNDSEQQSVEDILRPLAEAHDAPGHWDARFEALRAPKTTFMPWYGKGPVPLPFTTDASLGAIVRAAEACGLRVTYLSLIYAQVESTTYREGPMEWIGEGTIPEEALARALVAAGREEQP